MVASSFAASTLMLYSPTIFRLGQYQQQRLWMTFCKSILKLVQSGSVWSDVGDKDQYQGWVLTWHSQLWVNVRTCLSRDNTITVLKIMHFLGFFNLCVCATIGHFCLLGHFFSFKGLSNKVLHHNVFYHCVYLLRDLMSSCKLTSPSPSWSAREKIVWISWSLNPDFLRLLLSSW